MKVKIISDENEKMPDVSKLCSYITDINDYDIKEIDHHITYTPQNKTTRVEAEITMCKRQMI